jgi:hypothetical protein
MTNRLGVSTPPEVATALQELCAELRSVAGDNIRGVVLYGGLARGRYRRGISDVNVLILLRDASADAVARIAPALHEAWRALRVEPFILAEGELSRAALLFPTKLLDIQLHHVVLTGDDPLVGLAVDRGHVRLRVEQELRNLALRMRRRLVAIRDDRAEMGASVANAAAPLAANLRALLHLADETTSATGERPLALFDRAAAAFGLDREALAAVRAARDADSSAEVSLEMYGRVLAALTRAADVAAELKRRDGSS